jgi:biopolymer transport protein ExbB
VAIQGLDRRGLSESKAREEVQRVAAAELKQLSAYLRVLDSIVTLAPLLGLFGTVLGMIEAFRELEAAGGRADPALLAGGIWEALLTTAAGLGVAIPASAALHWLESVVERVRHDMEDAATRVFTTEISRHEATPNPAMPLPERPLHAD